MYKHSTQCAKYELKKSLHFFRNNLIPVLLPEKNFNRIDRVDPPTQYIITSVYAKNYSSDQLCTLFNVDNQDKKKITHLLKRQKCSG